MTVGTLSDRPLRALLLASAAGLLVPVLLLAVRAAASGIPQPAIESDYLTGVVWSLVLGATIPLWPVAAAERRALLLLWAVRCLVTLGLMLAYEGHYSLDAFNYFARSLEPSFPTAAVDPVMTGGTAVVYQLSWIHNHVLPPSYHALKVSFSMIGLVGTFLFYAAARRLVPTLGLGFLYLLGLFPSIVFWSSTLGKDPVAFLGIALYALGAAGVLGRSGVRSWLLVAAGVFIAAAIRIWLAPILLLPLVVPVIAGQRTPGRRLLAVVVLALAAAFAVRSLAERFRVRALADVYSTIDAMTQSAGWEGGSSQQLDLQIHGAGDVVRFLPVGMFTALFRPLPGEVRNLFGLLAGLEDALLLVLALLGLRRLRRTAFRDPIAVWAATLVLLWAAVYGFVSSLNFGAGVRFKLQILPVLLGLLLYLARARPVAAAAPRAAGLIDDERP